MGILNSFYTQANLVFADAAFTKVPLEATLLPPKKRPPYQHVKVE